MIEIKQGKVLRDGEILAVISGTVVTSEVELHHTQKRKICEIMGDDNLDFLIGKEEFFGFDEDYDPLSSDKPGEPEPEPDRDPRLGEVDPVWMKWLLTNDPNRFFKLFPPIRMQKLKQNADYKFFPDVFEGGGKIPV